MVHWAWLIFASMSGAIVGIVGMCLATEAKERDSKCGI